MGGTKIVVVHIKEILKSALFAVLGIALIIMLILFFIPKSKPEQASSAASLYVAGKYTSEIMLQKNPVNVEVTVSENEILSIKLKNLAEEQQVFYPLIQPTMELLAAEIISNQAVPIELSTENVVTERVLLNAIKLALAQAEIPEI